MRHELVHGRYEVTSVRDFRMHPQGTVFEARLEANQERRAIARGSIALLERVVTTLEPGSFIFPRGWLEASQVNNPREEA